MKRIQYLGLFVCFLPGLTSCELTNNEFRTVGSGKLEIASTGEVVDLEDCLADMPEPDEGLRDLRVSFICSLESDPSLEGRQNPGLLYAEVFDEAELEDMEGEKFFPLRITYNEGNDTKREFFENRVPYQWSSDGSSPWSLRRMEFSVSSASISGSFALIREDI